MEGMEEGMGELGEDEEEIEVEEGEEEGEAD